MFAAVISDQKTEKILTIVTYALSLMVMVMMVGLAVSDCTDYRQEARISFVLLSTEKTTIFSLLLLLCFIP